MALGKRANRHDRNQSPGGHEMSSNELDTTVDEWRGAMEGFAFATTLSSLPFLENGKTTGELAETFNVSRDTISRRLKALIKKGTCRKGRGIRTSLTGQEKTVPVYQLITPKKEKKR